MLERFQPAGAVLALTIAAGLPLHELHAAETEATPADTQATSVQPKAETDATQRKPPEMETQATNEQAQPATEETAWEDSDTPPSNGMKTFDALAVRPVTFISSVFSTGAFVLALPFAAFDPAMDVEKTRKNLVEEPFQDTFQRPLGDFNGSAW